MLPIESSEFPYPIEQTRVVLLPVNPYLVHLYWEVASEDLKEIEKLIGRPISAAQPVLRFHDITCIIFDGTNAHSQFDVNIDLGAKNWYVHLWSPHKSYCVDLGLRSKDGRFYPMARSNVAETPRVCPSEKLKETDGLIRGNHHGLEGVPLPVDDVPGPVRTRESSDETRSTGTERRTTEPRSLQEWRRLVSKPKEGWSGNLKSELSEETDLTAINERSFRFGISSGRMTTREENAGHSDLGRLKRNH